MLLPTWRSSTSPDARRGPRTSRRTRTPAARTPRTSSPARSRRSWTHTAPSLEYVVLVGGDSVIPFFRYPDPALLGNEKLYVPPVDTTASQASLRLGYVLSDDFLASRTPSRSMATTSRCPTSRSADSSRPLPRSPECSTRTASRAAVSPTSSLVTGYDFLTDAAVRIRDTPGREAVRPLRGEPDHESGRLPGNDHGG